jgi:hyperosmotically inducible periplasmic protein
MLKRVLFISMLIMALPYGLVRASNTDARIETSFKDSLVYQEDLKDDDIQVTSRDGVVTLTGIVSKKTDKTLAEHVAGGLPEVKRVNNQLKVKEP